MNLRLLIPFFDPTVKDWSLTARLMRWLTFLWIAIGILVLFSASYYHGEIEKKDGFFYFNRQIFYIIISLVIFNATVHTPLRRILKIAPWFLLITLALLWLTVLTGMGQNTMGATRWIALGPIQIQPSELIKPLLVLQGAKLFGKWEQHPMKVKATWLGIFVLVLFAILRQPNLSTTSLCGLGLWSIAFAAGLPLRYLAGTAAGGAMVAGISLMMHSYQRARMLSFIDPWADRQGNGFQLVQSLLAIGSGGLWGNGFGLSQQKLDYLPIQDTDFIFSVFAEEFGLVGSVLLAILVMSYGTLGLLIASRSHHPVHQLIAVGSTSFIVIQSLFNIGVATGMLPTTGLPLPMFSYGGSSMVASVIQSALLIRVARESAAAKVMRMRV
ncbi:FtsW/RodA/SpoVE family cell cycle protein [Chamaesiphon minutus]|uniref:Probable peptidoglycan glycosyltransferase FtsW n=1 Tax=Chamaesiphon minutus (strain ATCC 27169 / PCC 6605) TaxID=1173020 RepID=K9UNF1_CHAP6|nr:FtsW/RodA/SpoVE family cell cycle protein [Chamaesiphon minutus]AFY96325.1 bacterial cell division membrane protein [Chamaesiphon minutus PCC 6605]